MFVFVFMFVFVNYMLVYKLFSSVRGLEQLKESS